MALGLVALSFGLTVPSDLTAHGDITPGGLVSPTERINTKMLDACVATRMTSLILPSSSAAHLAAGLLPSKLEVYKGCVKVISHHQ